MQENKDCHAFWHLNNFIKPHGVGFFARSGIGDNAFCYMLFGRSGKKNMRDKSDKRQNELLCDVYKTIVLTLMHFSGEKHVIVFLKALQEFRKCSVTFHREDSQEEKHFFLVRGSDYIIIFTVFKHTIPPQTT